MSISHSTYHTAFICCQAVNEIYFKKDLLQINTKPTLFVNIIHCMSWGLPAGFQKRTSPYSGNKQGNPHIIVNLYTVGHITIFNPNTMDINK